MTRTSRLASFVVAGLLVATVLAVAVSPFASSEPDGLERVAMDEGFMDTATDHATADNPLADYGVRGVADARLSTGLAGLIGVVLCFSVAGGAVLVLRRRSGPSRSAQSHAAASSRSAESG